ncbi:MAG: ABC transporter ATP-binding protein [Phycisphaerales bacterium]|nr:MAG: ABC transporter ATP-binding protein [Phycisphaerales bacterium]
MLVQADAKTAGCDTAQGAVVESQGLTKIFRRLLAGPSQAVCALKDVSLSVHAGQIVGLIGPNGAGKSTLLNLIAGLIVPTEGHVTVCGHRARSVAARRHLGFMPEHPVFPGVYTARAVLRYHGALLGLSARAIATQVDRAVQQLQMQEFIDRPASDFSQGMKQRLALAIAMMGDPQLLLLDEPSNGLDPVGIVQLRDLLKRLRDTGAAVVISSHRLGELEKLTSDYLFMHRGQIVSIAEKVAASQGGQLRIELVSDGVAIAERLLPASKVLSATDKELMIAIADPEEVPSLVRDLAQGGARIMSVLLQRENIEDLFLRLCNEGT